MGGLHDRSKKKINTVSVDDTETWLWTTSQLLDLHNGPYLGSNTSTLFKTFLFWHTIHFYTVRAPPRPPPPCLKAVMKNFPGDMLHRERKGLTTTRRCLFWYARKRTHRGDRYREKRCQRTPSFSLWMDEWWYKRNIGSINADYFPLVVSVI